MGHDRLHRPALALLLTLDNSEPRYTLEFFPVLIVWQAR